MYLEYSNLIPSLMVPLRTRPGNGVHPTPESPPQRPIRVWNVCGCMSGVLGWIKDKYSAGEGCGAVLTTTTTVGRDCSCAFEDCSSIISWRPLKSLFNNNFFFFRTFLLLLIQLCYPVPCLSTEGAVPPAAIKMLIIIGNDCWMDWRKFVPPRHPEAMCRG